MPPKEEYDPMERVEAFKRRLAECTTEDAQRDFEIDIQNEIEKMEAENKILELQNEAEIQSLPQNNRDNDERYQHFVMYYSEALLLSESKVPNSNSYESLRTVTNT